MNILHQPTPTKTRRFSVVLKPVSARLFRQLLGRFFRQWIFSLLLVTTGWAAADTYRYKQPDGGVIFTDVKLSPGESKTVSIASIGSRRGYRSSYGRPTATASCSGISPHLLDTRYSSIASVIDAAAAEYGVDPLLVKAIARVESCYDSSAISGAGAQGIMQLMPATARELSVTNSFDPVANIRGGTQYISWLLERYDGDKELALAAYNAGPGAVDKHQGIPPYRETMNYVPKVLKHFASFSSEREAGNLANR